ncbi:hypothetical protein LTR86_002592 [Recurvomyces mirabilis]|nr:hypothetical protein LTR86_002592 [Recurvomyces mirabilis]
MNTFFTLLATMQLVCSSAASSQYNRYRLASTNETLYPISLDQVNGTVTNASSLVNDTPGNAIFTGPSSATYDFGRNIAGNITLTVGDVDADQYIGVHFTGINASSSDGCAKSTPMGTNETFWFFVTGPGNFTVPRQHERGSFQYLSLLHNTTGRIQVQQISVQ